MSRISAFILRLLGWKIQGQYDNNLPRVVLIVIPHTSNWDFPLGLLVRSAIKGDIIFVAKSSLFRFPFGWLFRVLGGYPVERSKSTNYVQMMVDVFNKEPKFHIVISPEGTRSKVDKLKTGFYYIAKGAGAAIVMCRFDWGNRVVEFRAPFYPTADMNADFKLIDDYFRGIKGKRPANGYLYEA
jgi:1-acyl-sn-glycerol-3-phosphate acyltransferase